jgi:hypothetical protein
MPRGPDWLLGFGFQAKDRGLSKYLSDVTKQLEGLGSAMKDFQQINKQSARGSSRGGRRRAGADVERISKQVGKRGSAMSTHSMGALAEEIDEIVSVVDKGLTRVKAETRDISLGLHKHIEKMFSEIEDGSITSAEALGALPNVLLKIPLLSKDAVRSLKDLNKQVKTGKIEPKKLAKELVRIQKQVMQAVEESSGYVSGKKKSGQFASFFDGLLHGGKQPWERTLKDATEGWDVFWEKIDKRFKGVKKGRQAAKDALDLPVGEATLKGLFNLGRLSGRAIGSIKNLAKTSKRFLKPIGELFFKRFFKPSTQLGKQFARRTLTDRLFGKKQQLVGTRRELAAVGDSVEDFAGLATATEAAAKDSTKSVAGVAEKMANAATEAVADPNSTEKITASFKELVSKLHYDVAPLIADELAQLTNLFSHGRRSIVEETRQLDNEVSANFSNLIDHGINRLPTALDEALLASRHKLEGFGKFMSEWITGDYSAGFTKFRERITRSARTFDKLREKASSAFTNILLEKELFVKKFEDNFERLSSNVTASVGRISVVTESEFNQMESQLSASYSQLEKISRMGVEQQTDAIRRSFSQLRSLMAKQPGAIGASGASPAQGSMASSDIVDAINSMSAKLLEQLRKNVGTAAPAPAGALTGKLSVSGDDFKNMISGVAKMAKGRKGGR